MKKNFNVQVDLLKLKGARLEIEENGALSVEIPVQDGGPVYVIGGHCYLRMTAFELTVRKDDITHLVKPAISMTQRFGMSREGIRAIPYIGNMKPWTKEDAK